MNDDNKIQNNELQENDFFEPDVEYKLLAAIYGEHESGRFVILPNNKIMFCPEDIIDSDGSEDDEQRNL